MTSAPVDAKKRVKLYALNGNRQWDDKGTGHVTSSFHEALDGISLIVTNELDGTLLLESKIQLGTNYQKQQGTLIVWTENDDYDLALSFQEKEGCNEIWEKICQVQGRDPTLVEQYNEDEQEDVRLDLIECDHKNLHQIIEQIAAYSQSARKRDALASDYIENDYIQKLLDVFKKCEESQDIKALHQLYEIFKQLFLYDRPTLTEAMVADGVLMNVIGVFEYDSPDMIDPTTRTRHREFLQSGASFKEVIPFGNDKLVDKIHQTYRVQYLQSSVLPSTSTIMEENSYNSISNLLFFNKVEIVSMIQENGEFLQNLFNQIMNSETSLDKKRELVLFLREYCIFSQTIQQKNREDFFKTLASYKILSAVEVALSCQDPEVKSAAIDIFTYLVEYSPSMTREHAVQQKEGVIDPPNCDPHSANIIKLVIEHITTDQDPELGTAIQLSCIIRILLDPENMSVDGFGRHTFLEFFYSSCMQSLTEPIKNSTTESGDLLPSANDRKTAQMLSIMLELLTFFMEHHYTNLRTYGVPTDLLVRIMSLVNSRHKFLVLSVIRFFRKLIATKDSFYIDIIIKESLLNPIIQVLKNNSRRYNLLDSAILELFEFIQTEELITLMNHILSEYGTYLDSIDYVNTFKVMRQKKEQFEYEIQLDGEDSEYEFEPQIKRKKIEDS